MSAAASLLCSSLPVGAEAQTADLPRERWVVAYAGGGLDHRLSRDVRGVIVGSYIVRRHDAFDWRMLNITGVFTSAEAYIRYDTGVNLYDDRGRIVGLAAGIARFRLKQAFLAAYAGTPLRVGSLELMGEARLELHRRASSTGVAALLSIGIPLLR